MSIKYLNVQGAPGSPGMPGEPGPQVSAVNLK